MEVDDKVVAVTVPLGIYPSPAAYFSALQEAGRDQYPVDLKYFGVKFDPTQPFVSQVASIGVEDTDSRGIHFLSAFRRAWVDRFLSFGAAFTCVLPDHVGAERAW